MTELQATLEVLVELSKFYNVDLFQRGFYQIRTTLKTPTKSPVKVEVSLPHNSECHLVFPATVINGSAVSKTYQILYRNEDVSLNDIILFKVHALVDAFKAEECLDNLELQLGVDLWFTEEDFGPEQQEKFQCVSQRTLRLHLHVAKGLHHHVPVLFDYFHLSTICVTVHATLVALHQPYMSMNTKAGYTKSSATLESVLFGSKPSISTNNKYAVQRKFEQAQTMHRGICQILLSAYESLQSTLETLNAKLPPHQRLKIEHVNCHEKLRLITSVMEKLDSEEEILQRATSDIATLCAENVILWSQFMEIVNQNKITFQMAKEHHNIRVKRFAESFFTCEAPLREVLSCFDPQVHSHVDLVNLIRASNYNQGLLPLPLECFENDGDHTVLPIIFEDIYCETPVARKFTMAEEGDTVRSTESLPVRKGSKSSDSSVYSGDSASPHQHRQKLKFIKNIKPEAFKRPSSLIEGSGGAALVGGSVALDQNRCELVGYRKFGGDQVRPNPVFELGTLNRDLSEMLQRDMALYTAASMPTLMGKGRIGMANSESMPELHKGPSLLSPSPDQPPSAANNSLEVGRNVQLAPDTGQTGPEQTSVSDSPSDSSSLMHVENGYVSTNSDTEHCSPIQEDRPGIDYKLLADSISQALGEPEQQGEPKNACDSSGFPPLVVSQQNNAGPKPSNDISSTNTQSLPCDNIMPTPSLILGAGAGLGIPLGSESFSSASKDTGFATGTNSQTSVNTNSSPVPPTQRQKSSDSLSGEKMSFMELMKKETEAESKAGSLCAPGQPNSAASSQVSLGEISLESDESKKKESGDRPITNQPRRSSSLTMSASVPELSTVNKEQKLVSPVGDSTINFITAKENLRKLMRYNGHIYSDFPSQASMTPYFWPPDVMPAGSDDGIHLIICVHGLDGNCADLRLIRTYLEMATPGGRLDFLMSERNQPDTFADFEMMTDRLVSEIMYHVEMYGVNPSRVSFVGHSLGNLIIRSALGRPEMAPLLPKLFTFLSLSGPHLGTLYNSSGLVNMGMWFMQKWKKSGSLLQLSMKDHTDPRQTFLYKLSQRPGMEFFKNVLLVGSIQDRYVPFHSTRIELCKAALKDTSGLGGVYAEMVNNILQPIVYKNDVRVIRYDVFHALANTANTLIGRAAHIAVLDSEHFIEKFILVSALKYFQ